MDQEHEGTNFLEKPKLKKHSIPAMKQTVAFIKSKLTDALISRGVAPDDAGIIAEDYLSGELQGKQSHGLMAFPAFLKTLTTESFGCPKVVQETHALLVIEANKCPGIVVGRFAVGRLINMAIKEGIAAAYIKNMTSWLRPGTIASLIAEQNMIGLVANDGGRPVTAPPGGFEPVIGTNPIGIGIPTAGEPIVADMATSKKAWGQVRKARKEGSKLPVNTFYTQRGDFAENPDDAYSVVPMGDYKGFALGILIEILTSSLLNRPIWATQASGYRTATRGGIIIVLNPEKTTNLTDFKEANSQLVGIVKKSRKHEGVNEIFIAGERSARNLRSKMEEGAIDVDEELWKQLK